MWPQVKDVKEGLKYELLISGKALSDQLEASEGILDSNIFNQQQLNFVRLANSSLAILPAQIGNLKNLTHLELQANKLTDLPSSLSELNKLKLLDVSQNLLETLPSEIGKLTSLVTLNARQNKLTSLVALQQCSSLSTLDISMNKLNTIEELCFEELDSLSTLLASHNNINNLPMGIMTLHNLKTLNLYENKLTEVPSGLAKCSKLKEINFKGNPFTDRRFKKLVESDRGHAKLLIDYIRQNSKDQTGKEDGAKSNKKGSIATENTEIDKICHRLSILSGRDELIVHVSENVRPIRGYLVCCILKQVDLQGSNLKTFLATQTKLHESVCEKRLAATIATHDLAKIRGPLSYCAKEPNDILIQPLSKTQRVSASEFLRTLKEEAEAQRKQMKRNALSGIHKYLSLTDNLDMWPCIVDATGVVISLPPITNSHDTKIEPNTEDVLVEVTSNVSLKKAKEVMEALIASTVDTKLYKEKTPAGKCLVSVEQVRILDESGGSLRLLFPAKNDLSFDRKDIVVTRS